MVSKQMLKSLMSVSVSTSRSEVDIFITSLLGVYCEGDKCVTNLISISCLRWVTVVGKFTIYHKLSPHQSQL